MSSRNVIPDPIVAGLARGWKVIDGAREDKDRDLSAGEAAELLEAAVDDHVEAGGGLATVLPILQALADALRQSGRPTEVPSAYRRVIAAVGCPYPLPDNLTDKELREALPDPFRYEDAIELQRLNLEEVHSAYGHRHEATRQAIQHLLNTLQATLTALGRD